RRMASRCGSGRRAADSGRRVRHIRLQLRRAVVSFQPRNPRKRYWSAPGEYGAQYRSRVERPVAHMHTTMPLASHEAPVASGKLGEPLLALRHVGIGFGGIVALDDISFDLSAGHILGLIGPNGAGKTTLFNCVSRLYTPNRGTIHFEGQNLLDRSADQIPGIGIARTFQNLALFRTMSVLDNVRVGGHSQSRGDFFSDAVRLPWVRREE